MPILLVLLSPLKVRVKRLYLDRGFYSVPVIRWLKALNIPVLMPAVIRGKTGGPRQLLVGCQSYATRYPLTSATYGSVTWQMRVVCTDAKGFKGKHGIQYALDVVHRVTVALNQWPQPYKERFGLETSYRSKNGCRLRTTSKKPVLRLLFVALAFILTNLWVDLLWFFVSQTQRGGRAIYREWLRLKTMLDFLAHAVERHFSPITAIYLPARK